MLSKDEGYGIIGMLDTVVEDINRTQSALYAVLDGRFGKKDEPNLADILRVTKAVSALPSIINRLQDESNDPNGSFGA